MAWTYEQKFNALNTATLDGQDSWAFVGQGTANVVTTGTPYPDPTEVKHVSVIDLVGNETKATRTVAGVASGTVYISIKKPVNNSNYAYFKFYNASGGVQVYVLLENDGKIYVQNGASFEASGKTYTGNTYYRIGIQFECGAGGWEGLSADTWKFNIDGGSWSAALAFSGATTELNTIRVATDNTTGGVYFDYISPNYADAVGPANLKTYNTNAKANIKSINTNLIANVKTLDTNA